MSIDCSRQFEESIPYVCEWQHLMQLIQALPTQPIFAVVGTSTQLFKVGQLHQTYQHPIVELVVIFIHQLLPIR